MEEALPNNVAVLLPAAGSGLRFSARRSSQEAGGNCVKTEEPKQFLPVGSGHLPLFIHTVDSFSKIPWISTVLLLVQDSHLTSTRSLLAKYASKPAKLKCRVAAGAATRHRTIEAGIRELGELRPSLVIVHDVVRPFVDENVCRNVVMAAKNHGASGVFAALVSTILRIDSNGFMTEALPRAECFASEMPQAFTFESLAKVYSNASEDELENGTECLALVRKYTNCRIKMIPVDPNRYFKVTYEKDLLAVQEMLQHQVTEKVGLSQNGDHEDDFICDARHAPCQNCSSVQGDYP